MADARAVLLPLTLSSRVKLTHVSWAEAETAIVLVVRGRRDGRLAVDVGRDAGRDLLALELSGRQFRS